MQQTPRTTLGMDATFNHWTALTDAYAEQLAAMARGEPAARAEATRLSRAIRGIGVGSPALPPLESDIGEAGPASALGQLSGGR